MTLTKSGFATTTKKDADVWRPSLFLRLREERGAMRDWENHYAYLTKKFIEVSLEQLLESSGDSMLRLRAPLLRERMKDEDERLEDQIRLEARYKRVQEVYALIRDRQFFTDRQRQVLSLLFGWNGPSYVGPKSVSDIAKVLGVAQPVAFNHLRLAVKKLQKHFGLVAKKRKVQSDDDK